MLLWRILWLCNISEGFYFISEIFVAFNCCNCLKFKVIKGPKYYFLCFLSSSSLTFYTLILFVDKAFLIDSCNEIKISTHCIFFFISLLFKGASVTHISGVNWEQTHWISGFSLVWFAFLPVSHNSGLMATVFVAFLWLIFSALIILHVLQLLFYY